MTQPNTSGQGMATAIEGMRIASREFSAKSSEIQAMRSSVADEMSALRPYFTGEAGNTFQAAMDSWSGSLKNVIDKLDWMRQVMDSSMHQNISTAQETDQAAAQLQASLPGF
ncbi:WXG100 family type VII secretion target [Catenuloplanes japonicus]|uniref:WXG100 family type VII secretion target n=1 Tax=Catenuloplanes japonicus TaxID=33876 RepID=UPI000526EE70|nr:WXG100 family type VII secretion target [Catenuloplanes japonicus]